MPPELCVSDVDECFFDGDCVGDRKCCSNGCYRVCASPSLGPAAAAGKLTQFISPRETQCSLALDDVKGIFKICGKTKLILDKPLRLLV